MHCDNTTMHYTANFNRCKNDNFLFYPSAQNIDRRYYNYKEKVCFCYKLHDKILIMNELVLYKIKEKPISPQSKA